MQNAESILVIIVSSVLVLFLIVAITVMILIARLIGAVRRVVERGEQLIDSASEAAEMLKNASGPLALFRLLRNIFRAVEKAREREL